MTDNLENRFNYHPASALERQLAHQTIRTHCLELAGLFDEYLPAGRELALALTKLEEAMFWANAAIARQPD